MFGTALMSALPPKADINGPMLDVRFVPKADIIQCSKPIAAYGGMHCLIFTRNCRGL
jgi:hypothetical protein